MEARGVEPSPSRRTILSRAAGAPNSASTHPHSGAPKLRATAAPRAHFGLIADDSAPTPSATWIILQSGERDLYLLERATD